MNAQTIPTALVRPGTRIAESQLACVNYRTLTARYYAGGIMYLCERRRDPNRRERVNVWIVTDEYEYA